MTALIRTVTSWACRNCDAAGTGPTSIRDADRHQRAASHATVISIKPEEGK